jgi:hypothetical protein
MSRFEKFQKRRVFNEKDEPLYGQIFVHDCIINFEDGYINNWYNEAENELCPAIDCVDAHMEFWEKGVLHRTDGPAVDSSALEIVEFWKNGQLEGKIKYNEKNVELLKEKGREAEFAFANYLNKNKIPFIHLCQLNEELYSDVLKEKNIKRPDYMIFIDKKPLFIEVKATSVYTIDKKEDLEKLNALKNEYSIDVILAITDINAKEFSHFSFTALDNLNNYIAIIKNNEDTNEWFFYPYSKALLKNELIHNTINNEELGKIYSAEGPYNKYGYSDILEKYLKDNNYTIDCTGS